jgi:hypothetical protein
MKHLPAGALVVVIDDGSKPAAFVLTACNCFAMKHHSALLLRRTPAYQP